MIDRKKVLQDSIDNLQSYLEGENIKKLNLIEYLVEENFSYDFAKKIVMNLEITIHPPYLEYEKELNEFLKIYAKLIKNTFESIYYNKVVSITYEDFLVFLSKNLKLEITV